MSESGTFSDSTGGRLIQEKLNDDRTAQALGRMMDRLDEIERNLADLSDTMKQLPSMVSIAADTFDEQVKRIDETGVGLDERLSSLSKLLERLSSPGVTEKLTSMLDLVEQGPGLVSMAADTLDASVANLHGRGIDVSERLSKGSELVLKLTDPEVADKLDGLITMAKQAPGLIAMIVDSLDDTLKGTNLMGPENMALLTNVMNANQYARTTPSGKVGLFKMLKMMKDPDIQRANGFLINFLKAFGKGIKKV
jgi:uncharacterized protein YjgD (DUF1641 family)